MRHAPWRHRESTGCGDCVWRRQRTGVIKLRALELNSVIHIHHNGRAVYVGDGEHDVTRNGNVRRCGLLSARPPQRTGGRVRTAVAYMPAAGCAALKGQGLGHRL
jgi:hypothetical protein